MEKSLFRFIWKFSARQQLTILFITVLSYPVSYILLELPKLIVNDAVQGDGFPRDVFGFEFDQISYLFLLCLTFLFLVIVSNGIKLGLNVYKGRLGERMLRRLRFELFQRVLRFRLPHFRKVSSGEIIPMITAEVEDVGGFIGEAVALPAYQGGLLAVQLGFIFMQDPLLGLAAISSYPVQAYIIPKLQRKVVLLSRERVKNVRVISDKVGEAIGAVPEIHANDASAWHSADVADRLYANFKIRYEIYNRKYFIKFLNNFMNQLTPFFFYMIGGYLVIEGSLSIGALLAVIAAYKDLAGPWKELLDYYQLVSDVDVKYQTVVENFDPADIYPVERLTGDERVSLDGTIVMSGVSFSGGAAGQEVFSVNLEVPRGQAVAVVGADGSGRAELLQLAAGLISPTAGRVEIAGHDLDRLTESTLGREIAYVGASVHVWTGTIRDNLYYGLRHRPMTEVERKGAEAEARRRALREAKETRNPTFDIRAVWEDLASAGVSSQAQLDELALQLLTVVGLDSDIYRLGLQSRFDPSADAAFAGRILAVRRKLADRIAGDPKLAGLVEMWDLETFNQSATLAENLFFAVPTDPAVTMEQMVTLPEVRAFLTRTGLNAELQGIGLKIAETMVELFANVSSDSGLLGTYSFITPDDLPDFDRIIRQARSTSQKAGLSDADKERLISLAFKLIPARHRLGLPDEAMRERLIEARQAFRKDVLTGSSAFIAVDPDAYLPPLSIEDNLLFGRARVDRRDARQRIDALIRTVVEEEALREPIIFTGFGYHVGVSGSKLSAHQRRKVALVRALLKNASVTILDDVAAGTGDDDVALRRRMMILLDGRTVLFGTSHLAVAGEFTHSVQMEQGRVVRQDGHEPVTGQENT
ncbi:ATP-binding cassette domain-containing protein [Microvirga tunisiensis]|uniref:ATP-binding cassette domain-containing protein n=2 Tax=Pannonibacter tanglangensis TaxID=2750084 RepID=A0ABW9ZCN7_9HYPH|nr:MULTISPECIES: ATP-binding cassette domain-containing protein [unclassified Pannonibacter]NBN62605.1 ATP-binding cassette domain-containing protein [Pannonibacter sp. XCT-34]NBN78260.1 ATP-binding cassette domain-containing protein [Pannonibacter sp. XCT-53]